MLFRYHVFSSFHSVSIASIGKSFYVFIFNSIIIIKGHIYTSNLNLLWKSFTNSSITKCHIKLM